MADIELNSRYPIAEATRGSWARIDSSTLSVPLTSTSRGKYAQLNYIVGAEPGTFSMILCGSTVILPVSTVNLSEPLAVENTVGQDFVVTINQAVSTIELRPNQTLKGSVTIAPLAVSSISFSPTVQTVEVFNNDQNIAAYVDFVDSNLATVSAEGLPVLPEAFYSVDRETSVMYVGNADASNSVDIRIIGHYRA